MVISASDYKNKFSSTKIVSVEEGIDFEIKQISPIKFLELNRPNQEINMADHVKTIILNGVKSPEISDKVEEGKIFIGDIKSEHLTKLVTEIMVFSDYLNADGSQKSFFSDAKKPSGSIE